MTAIAGPAVVAAESALLGADRASTRRRRRRRAALRTGVQAALVALWCLLPVYWMVAASLRPRGDFFSTAPVPVSLTLGNYVDAFDPVDDLLVGLVHSLGIAMLVTLVVLLLGTTGGYALSRLAFAGRGAVVGIVLAGSMLPAVALLTPMFALFSHVGLAGTFAALILPAVALALPFGVYSLAVFFRDTPWELEDAALLDGCSRPQAFVRVLLPLLAPAIVTVALLSFIATWNEYVIASVLSTERTVTMTVVIANFAQSLALGVGGSAAMAAGVVATLPPIVLVLLFQRRITAGLTGGLKG